MKSWPQFKEQDIRLKPWGQMVQFSYLELQGSGLNKNKMLCVISYYFSEDGGVESRWKQTWGSAVKWKQRPTALGGPTLPSLSQSIMNFHTLSTLIFQQRKCLKEDLKFCQEV